LDFVDNSLFQREVLEDEHPDADEDEFNEFCQFQLSKAGISVLAD